jgi:hypothetical protein
MPDLGLWQKLHLGIHHGEASAKDRGYDNRVIRKDFSRSGRKWRFDGRLNEWKILRSLKQQVPRKLLDLLTEAVRRSIFAPKLRQRSMRQRMVEGMDKRVASLHNR